jgi:hypothetical protein
VGAHRGPQPDHGGGRHGADGAHREPALPGTGPSRALSSIPFPELVRNTSYFDHFEIHWVPSGHIPDRYAHPHFDAHFYSIPEIEVLQIYPPDPQPPAANRLPAGYVYLGPNAVTPQMGVHAFPASDLGSPQPFSAVMVAGFFNNNMIFLEPMFTHDFIMANARFSLPVPRPTVLGRSTLYPQKFEGRRKKKVVDFVFSQFSPIQ